VIERTCHDFQRPFEPRRRYCGSCGTRLVALCARCGFENGGRDHFCGLCGEGLTPAAQVTAPSHDPPAPILVPVAPTPSLRVSQQELDVLFEQAAE